MNKAMATPRGPSPVTGNVVTGSSPAATGPARLRGRGRVVEIGEGVVEGDPDDLGVGAVHCADDELARRRAVESRDAASSVGADGAADDVVPDGHARVVADGDR